MDINKLLALLKENDCSPYEALRLLQLYCKDYKPSVAHIGKHNAALMTASKKRTSQEMFYEYVWRPLKKNGFKTLDQILIEAAKQNFIQYDKGRGIITVNFDNFIDCNFEVSACEYIKQIKTPQFKNTYNYSTLRKWHTSFNKRSRKT